MAPRRKAWSSSPCGKECTETVVPSWSSTRVGITVPARGGACWAGRAATGAGSDGARAGAERAPSQLQVIRGWLQRRDRQVELDLDAAAVRRQHAPCAADGADDLPRWPGLGADATGLEQPLVEAATPLLAVMPSSEPAPPPAPDALVNATRPEPDAAATDASPAPPYARPSRAAHTPHATPFASLSLSTSS